MDASCSGLIGICHFRQFVNVDFYKYQKVSEFFIWKQNHYLLIDSSRYKYRMCPKAVNVDGVQWTHLPPIFIRKAMEHRWAQNLIRFGCLRLSSCEYYRELEDQELGDIHEGEGRYKVGDQTATINHVNKVYLFCASLPCCQSTVLMGLRPEYDTIIRINNPEGFTRLVGRTAHEQLELSFLVGIDPVRYDRDSQSSFDAINVLPFAWNLFQKSKAHVSQLEYRLTFQHFASIDPRLSISHFS